MCSVFYLMPLLMVVCFLKTLVVYRKLIFVRSYSHGTPACLRGWQYPCGMVSALPLLWDPHVSSVPTWISSCNYPHESRPNPAPGSWASAPSEVALLSTLDFCSWQASLLLSWSEWKSSFLIFISHITWSLTTVLETKFSSRATIFTVPKTENFLNTSTK